MILLINKWHRTVAGETSSSIKVEKPTEIECYREAQGQAYQLSANYSKDTAVIDWTVCIFDPKTMRVSSPMQYFTPNAQAEEPIEN